MPQPDNTIGSELDALIDDLVPVHRQDDFRKAIAQEANKATEAVDRFEVIDDAGRAYVKGSIYGSPVSVRLDYQDDGRTLKVFVTAEKSKP